MNCVSYLTNLIVVMDDGPPCSPLDYLPLMVGRSKGTHALLMRTVKVDWSKYGDFGVHEMEVFIYLELAWRS